MTAPLPASASNTDSAFGVIFFLVLLLVYAWNRYQTAGDREPVQVQLVVNPWLLIGYLIFGLSIGTFLIFADIQFKHPALVGGGLVFTLVAVGLVLARVRI